MIDFDEYDKRIKYIWKKRGPTTFLLVTTYIIVTCASISDLYSSFFPIPKIWKTMLSMFLGLCLIMITMLKHFYELTLPTKPTKSKEVKKR